MKRKRKQSVLLLLFLSVVCLILAACGDYR